MLFSHNILLFQGATFQQVSPLKLSLHLWFSQSYMSYFCLLHFLDYFPLKFNHCMFFLYLKTSSQFSWIILTIYSRVKLKISRNEVFPCLKFEGLMAVKMSTVVSWVEIPCRWLPGPKMEAVCSYKTLPAGQHNIITQKATINIPLYS